MLFGHSLVWIMVPVCHVRMSSTGVRAPVWTASGMGHWKRLTKIPGGTDCDYCINNMTCLIHVYYCLDALVTVHDHLSAIMLHVHVVTFPISYYTFCDGILFMYMYTLHCKYSAFCVLCILHVVYAHHSSMSILHMPICMLTSITSPLACSLLLRHHSTILFITQTGYDYRHDPMITC